MKKQLISLFLICFIGGLAVKSNFFASTSPSLVIYISEGFEAKAYTLEFCGSKISIEESVFVTSDICEGHIFLSRKGLKSQPVYLTSGINLLVEYKITDGDIKSKINIF